MAGDSTAARVSTVASDMTFDIGGFIRAQRQHAQVSLRQLAERSGVSNPYLSQIERGLRKPSADVLNQIAKALRVSAEVLYVRAGMLEPGEPSGVRDAVVADTQISERQKSILLDIYSSFVQQNDADTAASPAQPVSEDESAAVPCGPTREEAELSDKSSKTSR